MIRKFVEPLPGYSPEIGRLVSMLTYIRGGLLHAVDGLTRDELDHLHDPESNSIGALLAHAAAVERLYQIVTFEDREPTAADEAPMLAALDLGESGRRELHGRDLAEYLDDLSAARKDTLEQLALRDDAWLDPPLSGMPDMNAHWAWFHVAEDEINHRGQIEWLKKRLPGRERRSE